MLTIWHREQINEAYEGLRDTLPLSTQLGPSGASHEEQLRMPLTDKIRDEYRVIVFKAFDEHEKVEYEKERQVGYEGSPTRIWPLGKGLAFTINGDSGYQRVKNTTRAFIGAWRNIEHVRFVDSLFNEAWANKKHRAFQIRQRVTLWSRLRDPGRDVNNCRYRLNRMKEEQRRRPTAERGRDIAAEEKDLRRYTFLPGVAHTVELQRQFLALRRAGALPLQARLERRSLSSCALLTHKELSFVFSLGASLPSFLPNQVTLQLHFRCSHELRTLSETFHTYQVGGHVGGAQNTGRIREMVPVWR